MFKKILYIIAIIIIIVIVALMIKGNKKEIVEAPVVNNETPKETVDSATTQIDTSASITNDLNNIDLNSGIDTELNTMDTQIKTL